ncbi:3'-5' exonuclease [Micromonospora sp. LOL_024]|uniref:3'-5' exonuclease n=1 Tax=Micromonospora sp. LOL_024 TaxID=3345412 RepID=UPI003A85E3C8
MKASRPGQALKVGTYLRAKGLEFKYVYLPCHDQGLKAAQLGGSADVDRLALARRQLFVAMTRARDLLWLGSITGGAPAIGELPAQRVKASQTTS